MFDYARNMRLAVKDAARRMSLKAGAGVAVVLGLGFLLAALWTFLAYHAGLGSLGASLVIGLVFVVIGAGVFLASNKVRHRPPTTDDLKAEVEERVSLATEAVLDRVTDRADQTLERAQKKASQLVDQAGNSVNALVDKVSYTADRFAGKAETQAYRGARRARQAASDKLGLTPERVEAASERVAEGARRARDSNAAAIAPVIGALAAGITLAMRLRRRRDDYDPHA